MKEWITGRNPVYECLRAKRRHFYRLLVNKGSDQKGRLGDIIALARKERLQVEIADKSYLDDIHENHQGVALQVGDYPYSDLNAIIAFAQGQQEPLFILIADQVQDVQNLGTLIRAAEIFGVHRVLIPARRSADVTPAVVNASSGASEHLRIAQINLSQAIDQLKEIGTWVVGLDMDQDARELSTIDLSGHIAIVVGSEGSGLRRLVRDKCDHIAYIPMVGQIDSLNAAVSGSIALYEALKARKR
jgi:23S rRNA (guanosine2251-2'-O)-methyltransferase